MTENVLFARNTMDVAPEENDEWDDTLLVKAYDKAVKLAKEKIAAKLALERNEEIKEAREEDALSTTYVGTSTAEADVNKRGAVAPTKSSNKQPKWKVGMSCRAEYSADGRQYEAVIQSIDSDEGTCIVKYLGYDNEEEVELDVLGPSRGKDAQLAQKREAAQAAFQNSTFNDSSATPAYLQMSGGVIPPPPPPFVMAGQPKDETDALSAMLMSWYMSGYHTGYYQGMTRGRMSDRQSNLPNGH